MFAPIRDRIADIHQDSQYSQAVRACLGKFDSMVDELYTRFKADPAPDECEYVDAFNAICTSCGLYPIKLSATDHGGGHDPKSG
jgi:hypothetical protein